MKTDLSGILSVVLVALLGSQACALADESWTGGNGTWDFNNTANWTAGKWVTNDQVANFFNVPGIITTDNAHGQVGESALFFASSTTSPWEITGSVLAVNGTTNLIVSNTGNGNVTIDSDMIIDTTRATDRYNVTNDATTLTLDGNITFGTAPGQNRSLIVGSQSNSSVINLNGTYSDSSSLGGAALDLRFGEAGATTNTYNINGNVSGLSHGISIGSGNVVVHAGANLGSVQITLYDDQGDPTENGELLEAGGATISNSINISKKYDSGGFGSGVLGTEDVSSSKFIGAVSLDNSGLALTAVSDGRATFSGDFSGHTPNGITKTGLGTVVLAQSVGNSYGLGNDFGPSGTLAMEVKAGNLLIANTSGSAFGNNAGKVHVEAGATLGGSGTTIQEVVTQGPTAAIAAGDMGQSSLNISPAIATLHLYGGVDATAGATFDFKLNGFANDKFALGVGDFNLNGGVINVDFIELGTVLLGTSFTLATGSGVWSDTGTKFNFQTDSIYRVASYNFNTSTDSFSVVFTVPEPSTWIMLSSGALALLGFRGRSARMNSE